MLVLLSTEASDITPVAVSQIAGQPINSTEQEVIGLLLAQQQVFTNSGKLEPSSVYVAQSTNPSSVAVVTDDVLQSHGAEGKAIVMVTRFSLFNHCFPHTHCYSISHMHDIS